jgi:hypothetical protein
MRSFRSTTSSTKQNSREKLVFVREGVLYGLVIEKAKVDTASINRGIVSTPTVVYYNNNTKCLIDYSNQTNKDLETKLEEYFSQIENGTGLTLYNGSYTDTNSNISADLSGGYVFRSYYNGIIEADVTSATTLSPVINRYDKTRFDEIPYIIAQTITQGVETKTIIKNKLGKNTKNSFNYLGVRVGDYIKLTDISSQIKIIEMTVDSDGNEYVVVDKDLDAVDLTNLKTKVDVYYAVIDSYVIPPDLTETETGACIEYFNGIVISCTDNHTPSQCRFRSSSVNSIVTELTLNTFCSTPETDTSIQRNTSDNLVQLTTTLANALNNISNGSGVAGVINKNGNTKNGFYGRPF